MVDTLTDGPCVWLQPEYQNNVWSYDLDNCRTTDEEVFRTLNILDEQSREDLMIRVSQKLNAPDVIVALTDLLILWGTPAFIQSDIDPEFVAQAV